jgi:predicted CoA-substrate-specific enzyme activase
MKRVIGVCLGASTVSFVKMKNDDTNFVIEDTLTLSHNGNPKEVFSEKLMEFNPQFYPVVVTGRKFRNLVNLTQISEPEATEYALEYIKKGKGNFSAVASLGGETFIVYILDNEGKISNVITKNQCASGTGEFFLQQIKRMDLNLDEIGEIPKDVKPYRVSGRCSVFCKSDCTHALNKGVPSSEVIAGLSLMMAEKIEELLKRVKNGTKVITGGVTKNNPVMNYLRKIVDDIFIPVEAPYFEAMGAAIYGLKNEILPFISTENMFINKDSSFIFHKPISDYRDKVVFKEMKRGKASDGDECILGLDVGSTTTKAIILRISDNKILGSVYLYTLGNPIKAARKCYTELLIQVPEKINLIGLGTTGSGRHIAGLHALTDAVFNEIVAHAAAAVFFDPEVDTVFEIGGQDAKYTYLVNKVPSDYAMNEACSAGTGSFIEESAYESLGIKVEDIESIALNGDKPPNFSDQCAAFIGSDIKTALHENISKENIVAGLVYSICLNYVNRVMGNRPVGRKIFMQGGVCYNKAIPIAMAGITGQSIVVPPEPGLMGAFGVALEVKDKIKLGLLEKKPFNLKELSEREVIYKKPFICAGGREKCDLKCTVNLIQIEGKTYPFGGACNKYYGLSKKKRVDANKYDYVKIRQELMFKKYAPRVELAENTKTIGINLSFLTHSLYPLYYNFFTKLGFKVILPDKVDDAGLEREMTSFCYPGQLSLCLFQDLVKKNPDYYFVPNILELHVDEEEHYRIDNNATCVFVITEPYFLKEAFKDIDFEGKWISPKFNFAPGFESEEKKFIVIANQLGIYNTFEIKDALKYAIKMQNSYQDEMFAIGAEFMKFLEKNPSEFAMILLGRTYNSFTETANKGIPLKFASKGVYIIPYDMLDYRGQTLDGEIYWEGSKRIMKAAKIIKKHPQLYTTYITNFSCGPDSMIIPQFRTLMGTKPSLTLELDGHTADAGINTRIDAFLDIIDNYRKIYKTINDPGYSNYRMAEVKTIDDISYFIDSEGQRSLLTDPDLKILVPSMGDLSSRMFASAMKSKGINAEALPEGNSDILKYGRANTTGKECLPLILLIGSLVDYIENKWDGKEKIALFNVQSSGSCRLGQYHELIKNLIKHKRYKNVASFILMTDDGYTGLGPDFAKTGILALITADVLDDIRAAIWTNAKDPDKGTTVFDNEFKKLEESYSVNPKLLYENLESFSEVIKNNVPSKIPIEESKYIALLGEIYVRSDDFSHRWLNKLFATQGFVVKTAYISEWIYYIDYLIKMNLVEPDNSLKKKTEQYIRNVYMQSVEKKIKKILSKSGYYHYRKTDVEALLKHSKHIVPLEVKGEPGLTLGTAYYDTIDEYCGIINCGPFGCMPTRFSEAVGVPNMKFDDKEKAVRINNPSYKLPKVFNGHMNIPFLTIESDGNVYPQVIEARMEAFALQADRVAKLMKLSRKNGKSHSEVFNKFKIFTKKEILD